MKEYIKKYLGNLLIVVILLGIWIIAIILLILVIKLLIWIGWKIDLLITILVWIGIHTWKEKRYGK